MNLFLDDQRPLLSSEDFEFPMMRRWGALNEEALARFRAHTLDVIQSACNFYTYLK